MHQNRTDRRHVITTDNFTDEQIIRFVKGSPNARRASLHRGLGYLLRETAEL